MIIFSQGYIYIFHMFRHFFHVLCNTKRRQNLQICIYLYHEEFHIAYLIDTKDEDVQAD